MERVRSVAEGPSGVDRDLWQRLCRDLQVAAMAIPQECGGLDAPWSFRAIVLEELGRALTPVPYLSSAVLAATAIQAADDAKAAHRWLPGIATGDLVATLAAAEAPHDWQATQLATTAVADARGWRLTGSKHWVPDAADADIAVVLAATVQGPTMFVVELADQTVGRLQASTLDPTRTMATLSFDDAPAQPLGVPGSGAPILAAALRSGAIALAAEQLGVAQRMLETSVAYAKDRIQFGRAIGSFQAIKHLLADQLVENEALAAAVRYAALAFNDSPAEIPLLAHLCQAVASETSVAAAANAIQVHGGIGYTWEHDVHLYFKRATASRQWLGSPDQHREEVAALMFSEWRPEEEL